MEHGRVVPSERATWVAVSRGTARQCGAGIVVPSGQGNIKAAATAACATGEPSVPTTTGNLAALGIALEIGE